MNGQAYSLITLRKQITPLLFFLACLFLFGYLIYGVYQSYNWQFHRVWRFFWTYNESGLQLGVFTLALGTTLQLVSVSLLLALGVGLLLAAMNLSASPVALLFAKSFIGILRNTPLLMQLYLIYFVFAPIFNLSPFWAACVSLAFFEGSYLAEIFRAGIKALSPTQWEAGFSLGFSTVQTARYITLPQAIQNVLPSLTGQLVSLIKDTSLVSAIAVADLTMKASEVISETYLSFEIWLLVALCYLFLTSLVSIPSYMYEKNRKKLHIRV